MLIFAAGYAVAFLLGVGTGDLGLTAKLLIGLAIYLGWVGVVWQRYQADLGRGAEAM